MTDKCNSTTVHSGGTNGFNRLTYREVIGKQAGGLKTAILECNEILLYSNKAGLKIREQS